jgi:WASH complex subunit 7, C-terminal/WASH complex subunit 7
VTEIGNAMGYIRMVRSGGLSFTSNAIKFVPDLSDIVQFGELCEKEGLSAETVESATNMDHCVENMSKNFAEGTQYFRMLVNVFATEFRNESNSHLQQLFLIVPALTISYVDHMMNLKDKVIATTLHHIHTHTDKRNTHTHTHTDKRNTHTHTHWQHTHTHTRIHTGNATHTHTHTHIRIHNEHTCKQFTHMHNKQTNKCTHAPTPTNMTQAHTKNCTYTPHCLLSPPPPVLTCFSVCNVRLSMVCSWPRKAERRVDTLQTTASRLALRTFSSCWIKKCNSKDCTGLSVLSTRYARVC